MQTDGRHATTRKFKFGSESSSIFSKNSMLSGPGSWFELLYKGVRVAEWESSLYSISEHEPSIGILCDLPTSRCCFLTLEGDVCFKGKEGALHTLVFLKFFKKEIQDLLGWREGTEI